MAVVPAPAGCSVMFPAVVLSVEAVPPFNVSAPALEILIVPEVVCHVEAPPPVILTADPERMVMALLAVLPIFTAPVELPALMLVAKLLLLFRLMAPPEKLAPFWRSTVGLPVNVVPEASVSVPEDSVLLASLRSSEVV